MKSIELIFTSIILFVFSAFSLVLTKLGYDSSYIIVILIYAILMWLPSVIVIHLINRKVKKQIEKYNNIKNSIGGTSK